MSKDSNYAEWASSWWPPMDDEPVQRLNTRPMTRVQDAWFSGTLSGVLEDVVRRSQESSRS